MKSAFPTGCVLLFVSLFSGVAANGNSSRVVRQLGGLGNLFGGGGGGGQQNNPLGGLLGNAGNMFGGGGGGENGANGGNQGGLGGLVSGILNTVQGALPPNLDTGHTFASLKSLTTSGGMLSNEAWQSNADGFCTMFNENHLCKNGRVPLQSEMNEISAALNRRDSLRIIPQLMQKNWLSGVPGDLAGTIQQNVKMVYGYVDSLVTSSFKSTCRGGALNCLLQPPEAVNRRQWLKQRLINVEQTKVGASNAESAEDNVEVRFDRTLRIKRALLEKANINAEVNPADDGVIDQDILLTKKQADLLLNDLGKAGTNGDENLSKLPNGAPSPVPPRGHHRHRHNRAGVFFEEHFAEKWDISQPIPYTFDDSIAPWDQTDIRDAIAEIEKNTCIRFRNVATAPRSNYINYVKIDNPAFCGLSNIGRVSPVNTVYLSFQCGKSKGIAIHETMHALGVAHQHLRMDRDTYIKVDWNNVNPQYYDQFAVSDSKMFTTYGIQYAYDSIMHYNAYTSAINPRQPTMIPLFNSASVNVLGQRDRMSATDIQLLNKMYCKPANCVDSNIYCGSWALQGVCTRQGNSQWMAANCRKSCNLC